MAAPSLLRSEPDGALQAVVLLLHGGAEHSHRPVRARTGSWARARLLMRHLEGRLHARGMGVWLLRNEVLGWNAGHPDHPLQREPSPLPGARATLRLLAEERPGVPVVLVGHSMGARVAVSVAAEDNVVGVVGLAPWLPEAEPVAPLAGRHFAAAHGRGDRITKAAETKAFTDRAAEVALTAEFLDMGDVGHYLLRSTTAWNAFAAERAGAMVDALHRGG